MMAIANKKILIVEDDKPMAYALELKLQHENVEAKVALNGQEGIELLKKEKYGLVLCDLIMPVLDGFKLLEFIKEKEIKVPVIVLSNLGQAEDKKRARELGAVGFFVKSDTSIKAIVEEMIKFIG